MKLTRSQYLTTLQPVQAFSSALFSICLLPKQPEQVSSRRDVSRTATKGTLACRTSSPILISEVANRPLPIPPAARGSVLVVTDGRGFQDDMLDVCDVHSTVNQYRSLINAGLNVLSHANFEASGLSCTTTFVVLESYKIS